MRSRITAVVAAIAVIAAINFLPMNFLPMLNAVQSPEEPKDLARYFVVIKRNGPKRDHPEAVAAKIQAEHLRYLKGKRDTGEILVGGPFAESGDWRSISIINAPSEADARRVAAQDPAVLAGRLVFEIHSAWFPKSDFERCKK